MKALPINYDTLLCGPLINLIKLTQTHKNVLLNTFQGKCLNSSFDMFKKLYVCVPLGLNSKKDMTLTMWLSYHIRCIYALHMPYLASMTWIFNGRETIVPQNQSLKCYILWIYMLKQIHIWHHKLKKNIYIWRSNMIYKILLFDIFREKLLFNSWTMYQLLNNWNIWFSP